MKSPFNIDLSIERLKEIPSTNTYLAQLCKEGMAKEYHTVITEHQTEGRGQRGNSWESEAGKNLIFSIVLSPTTLKAKEQFYLSMSIASAIAVTLGKYTDGISIKWPNDIYWKDKKLGGILIEHELEGEYIKQSIVGIGLNVNQETFHSLAPNPVSLYQILDTTTQLEELFNYILYAIIEGYIYLTRTSDVKRPSILTSYKNRLYRKEGFYPYRDANGEFMAALHDIEPSGHLIVKDEQGTLRRYAFKEIEFILP